MSTYSRQYDPGDLPPPPPPTLSTSSDVMAVIHDRRRSVPYARQSSSGRSGNYHSYSQSPPQVDYYTGHYPIAQTQQQLQQYAPQPYQPGPPSPYQPYVGVIPQGRSQQESAGCYPPRPVLSMTPPGLPRGYSYGFEQYPTYPASGQQGYQTAGGAYPFGEPVPRRPHDLHPADAQNRSERSGSRGSHRSRRSGSQGSHRSRRSTDSHRSHRSGDSRRSRNERGSDRDRRNSHTAKRGRDYEDDDSDSDDMSPYSSPSETEEELILQAKERQRQRDRELDLMEGGIHPHIADTLWNVGSKIKSLVAGK